MLILLYELYACVEMGSSKITFFLFVTILHKKLKFPFKTCAYILKFYIFLHVT
jgi:hypothetical protein